MVNRLGPYFLQRVHQAAKVLESRPNQARQCYMPGANQEGATPGKDTEQELTTKEKSEDKTDSNKIDA